MAQDRLIGGAAARPSMPRPTTLAQGTTGRIQQWRMPRAVAFWVMAAIFFLLLFGAAAPSPLYRIYQAEWRFSSLTLTEVFAVYVMTLLAMVLIFGSLSDHVGRRTVIVAAMAINVGACSLFLLADDVGLLFAARALQGMAVGLAISALGAALIELQQEGSGLAPLVTSSGGNAGLAVGALVTSALVQYGPAPTHLIWWLLLGTFLAAIVAILFAPETGQSRPGVLASLRPQVSVPPAARGTFLLALPCLIAAWALGGLYLSLGPSLVAQQLHSQNLLWGGIVVFLLFGVGGVASFFVRTTAPATVMLAGCLFMLVGVIITFGAIATSTPWLFLSGTALAGVGSGTGFLGAFRTVVAQAAPNRRAGVIAAVYVVAYLSMCLPVLAGVATPRVGLQTTALIYSAAIAMLVAVTAATMLTRRRAAPRPKPTAAPPDVPPGHSTAPASTDRVVTKRILK